MVDSDAFIDLSSEGITEKLCCFCSEAGSLARVVFAHVFVHVVVSFVFLQPIDMFYGPCVQCSDGFPMVKSNSTFFQAEQTLLFIANSPYSPPGAGS